MLHHAGDGFSARPQVLAGIEFARIFDQDTADLRGHSQTQVGVYVDLADAVFDSFVDHVLRHALSAWNLSAVLVAAVYEFLQHGGCAVEYQRCIRNQGMDFLQPVQNLSKVRL